MEELQKYELVESFLQSVKQAQSKQEFLSKVQEFDVRYFVSHPASSRTIQALLSQKSRSLSKSCPRCLKKNPKILSRPI